MNTKKTKLILSLSLLIFFKVMLSNIPLAKAQGLAVYDASNFLQMASQIEQLSKTYQKQILELEEAIKQTNALVGSRNLGSLANSSLKQSLRRHLPSTWEETLSIIEMNNLETQHQIIGSISHKLYEDLLPLDGNTIYPNAPNAPISKSLDKQIKTTISALAASESSFNNTSQTLETYETFLSELNGSTDLKKSMDLQARISAENGLVLNEIIRLNTILVQLHASENNMNIASQRRAYFANKYDPEKAIKAIKSGE